MRTPEITQRIALSPTYRDHIVCEWCRDRPDRYTGIVGWTSKWVELLNSPKEGVLLLQHRYSLSVDRGRLAIMAVQDDACKLEMGLV